MRKSKLFAFITTIISVITLIGVVSSVADEVIKKSISLEVTYHQTESRAMLDDINKWRATGPSYWDPQNVQQHSPYISPLTYDYGLEKVAMQRAAELVLNYNSGHLRPDGSKCFTCYVDGVRAYGENIAKGQNDAEEVFEAWREDNVPYSGQGHRRSMLGIIYSDGKLYNDTFTAIGIACVEFNGQKYWVQEFGYTNTNTPETAAIDNNVEVTVEYTESFTPEGYMGVIDGYPPNVKISFEEIVNWNVAMPFNLVPSYHIYHSLGDMIISDVTDQAQIRWYDKDNYDSPSSDVYNDGNSIMFSNIGEYNVEGEAIIDDVKTRIPFYFTANVTSGSIHYAVLDNAGENVSETYSYYSLDSYCPDQYYLGSSPVVVELSLSAGNYKLIEGVDYTVDRYSNNTGVTQGGRPASVTITGIGSRFQGSRTIYFNILPMDLTEADIVVENPSVRADGEMPDISCTVSYKGQIISSQNYTVSFDCDIRIAGDNKIIITGTNNCTGICSKEFTVNPLDISGAVVTLSQTEYAYSGNTFEPTFELKIDGQKLLDTDSLSVRYENNKDTGIAKVIISGSNNYTGTAETTFRITAGDISQASVYLNYQRTDYCRSECRPGVRVYMGSQQLTSSDYTVRYEDNKDAGTAKVIIIGAGNYEGTKTVTFEITAVDLSAAEVSLSKTEYVYTGTENKPEVTVKLGSYILTTGVDYDVEYSSNIDAGTATVTVTGKNNYRGMASTTFTITEKNLSDATYNISDVVYDGTPKTPEFSVQVDGITLLKDIDYTYEYDGLINVGEGHVAVTGKGNFEGNLDIRFNITAADIAGADVTVSDVEYTGSEAQPEPTVTYGGKTLQLGTDYIVAYSDNTSIGTATITITGTGNYTGTVEKTFKVYSIDLKQATIVVTCTDNVYDGLAKRPSVTVIYQGTTLAEGVDYSIQVTNNINAGKATVTIAGIGGCIGIITRSFDINPATIAEASVVVPSGNYVSNGTAITPIPSVKVGGKTLVRDVDYNVSYTNNISAGTAKVTINGIGNYCGSAVGTFDINPAPTSVPSVTPTPIQTPVSTTPVPTQTPAQPEESESGVAGFVERLYTIALGRKSDSNGKAAWINAIKNGESGAEAAKGFLFSDEFLNKPLRNEEFVTILYKTFFDREADQGGLNAWVAALERGDSKQDVIMGFINSTEWANVCLKYGISSGGTGSPNIEVEPNEQVIAFATRLYTTCLKRNPDQNGLMAWARQLANLRDTGSNAAHGFFFSDEMNNNPVSNEEFVTRLYLTFMDRQPDQGGMNAWVGQLNEGVSREEVFQGFAQSAEFGAICANYGIIR